MDFRAFQALLNAGLRWHAREQVAAANAAAFPWLPKEERRKMARQMSRAAEPERPRHPGSDETAGWNALRGLVHAQAARFPLDEAARKKLQASTPKALKPQEE